MRIAHVNSDRGVDPTRKKGAAVHVEAMRRAFARAGASVVGLDESDPARLSVLLASADAVEPVDLVYERHALGSCAAAEFARSRGIPHVLEVNAPLADEEALYRGAGLAAFDPQRERAIFGAAARILCVSSECIRHAIERGANPGRVVLEPNGVDPELFRPRTDDRLRDELAPRGALVVGFHGRLRPWHNFGLLLEALEMLSARGHPVHLLALGEGDFAAAIGTSSVRAHATLVGWKPHAEAAAIVACMDVVPLTYSPDRPFWYSPLKLYEGMAVEAVPVVPRLGDLPESVRHGVEGLVYEPGSADELAGTIETLARSSELRRRLGANARRRAEGRTWDAIARRVMELATERGRVS